jgi:predicted GNAT family N-acyltransferase
MAVLLPARGTGVGSALLTALVDEARRRGFHAAALDAQLTAIGFYAKAGFTADGPTHLDAGIVHQPMRLRLDGCRLGQRDGERETAHIDEHVGDAG